MSKSKSPSQSAIETRYILAPHQVNAVGTAFGGVIMSWIDMAAAMVAQRHCEGVVVTASIDQISFKEPIHIGDHVILAATVNYVGTTSLEVGVRVTKENPLTGKQTLATVAYLTFVHLGKDGKPAAVPPLIPKTDDEKLRFEHAKVRVQHRKELRSKIKGEQ